MSNYTHTRHTHTIHRDRQPVERKPVRLQEEQTHLHGTSKPHW